MPPAKKPRRTIARRAAEPSTWGGIAGALASLAPFIPPQYQAAIAAAGAIAGAVAAFKADPGNPEG